MNELDQFFYKSKLYLLGLAYTKIFRRQPTDEETEQWLHVLGRRADGMYIIRLVRALHSTKQLENIFFIKKIFSILLNRAPNHKEVTYHVNSLYGGCSRIMKLNELASTSAAVEIYLPEAIKIYLKSLEISGPEKKLSPRALKIYSYLKSKLDQRCVTQ